MILKSLVWHGRTFHGFRYSNVTEVKIGDIVIPPSKLHSPKALFMIRKVNYHRGFVKCNIFTKHGWQKFKYFNYAPASHMKFDPVRYLEASMLLKLPHTLEDIVAHWLGTRSNDPVEITNKLLLGCKEEIETRQTWAEQCAKELPDDVASNFGKHTIKFENNLWIVRDDLNVAVHANDIAAHFQIR